MPVKVTGAVTVFVAMMNLRPIPNRSLPKKRDRKGNYPHTATILTLGNLTKFFTKRTKSL